MSKNATAIEQPRDDYFDDDEDGDESEVPNTKISSKEATDMDYSQWQVGPNGKYRAAARTVANLPSGVYKIEQDDAGLYLQLQNVISDNIVELPETANIHVLKGMKKFWTRKDRYEKFGFVYKRGVLLWGPPGCHSAGTEVIMYDGSLKKVEDVIEGDLLMGPDSTPRTVLALCRGRDDMYRVFPAGKAEPFDVNGHHDFSFIDHKNGNQIKMQVNDYLALSNWKRKYLSLWKPAGGIELPAKKLPVDPYFLGLWLGDGNTKGTAVTTADQEVVKTMYATASANALEIREEWKGDSNLATTYHITSGEKYGLKNRNPLLDTMQSLGIIHNKHIPDLYLQGSKEQRLRLLAGLLDSDGHYGKQQYFEITQKNKLLAEQIVFLARSLGYGANVNPTVKTIKKINFVGTYYRVNIVGQNLSQIPTRIPRKQVPLNINSSHVRIKKIESLGVQDYYGFQLDDDHLYETKDFIVNSNSGKSVTINLLMKELISLNGIVLLCGHPEFLAHMLQRIRQMEPDRPIIVVLEDIDEIIEKHGEHSILSMLDGENQIANVVYLATTNYPERLGARIVNRPSRFDERIFVGMPSEAARKTYLKFATKEFVKQEGGTPLSEEELDKWVSDTENFSIAHLRELVAAVYCLDQEYKVTLKRLKSMTDKPKFVDGFRKGNAGFSDDEKEKE